MLLIFSFLGIVSGATTVTFTFVDFVDESMSLGRLQVKPRLFWYRHHPKMHEMVSDRSSRAENLTDLRKISMRVFFDSNKCGKMIRWFKKKQI